MNYAPPQFIKTIPYHAYAIILEIQNNTGHGDQSIAALFVEGMLIMSAKNHNELIMDYDFPKLRAVDHLRKEVSFDLTGFSIPDLHSKILIFCHTYVETYENKFLGFQYRGIRFEFNELDSFLNVQPRADWAAISKYMTKKLRFIKENVVEKPLVPCGFKTGDTVTYLNVNGVEFKNVRVLGFDPDPDYDRTVILDYECYWFAVNPNLLTLTKRERSQTTLFERLELFSKEMWYRITSYFKTPA